MMLEKKNKTVEKIREQGRVNWTVKYFFTGLDGFIVSDED